MRNPRYPGPKPFQAQEHSLFFGRDKEISDLYRLVGTNKIVVLFGKSGFGKSSLIQAGLMPQLDKNQWDIVQIRFGLYDKKRNLTLCESLKKQLEKNEKLKNTEGGHFLEGDTLWHEFKRRHDESNPKTVVIFDQFEEFFSYPIEQQEAFQREIADVLYTSLPQPVVDAYEDDTFEHQSYLATPMEIRALFAIRADRLALLHGLKNHLPAILYARYELKGLTPEQAREAIEKPAAALVGDFDSPPFSYEPEALDCMTEQLSASKNSGVSEPFVEAVQLQIICQDIENKIRKGSLKDPVSKSKLPAFDAILENYYRQEIAGLESSVQYPARIIVEEKLISGQLEDGSARRATVDGSILAQELSVDESLLMILVDAHLLRREPNSVGGYSYEICHDTLLEPILKARKERQDEEFKIAEAKRQAEEAQKMAQERSIMQQKLDAEKRKRLFANRLMAIFVAIAVVFIGLSVYAYKLFKKAQVSGNVAQVSNLLFLKEPSDALSLAHWAFEENQNAQTEKALGNAFYAFLEENDGCIIQKIASPKEINGVIIKGAKFTEGGQKIEIQYDSTSVIWDRISGESKIVPSLNNSPFSETAQLFGGKLLVTKTDDTTFVIEDKRPNPVFKKEYKTGSSSILGVGLSPDGARILTIHRTDIRLWYWQDNNMVMQKGHQAEVLTAVISPNNTFFLTASKDSTARIWNRKGDMLAILRGHNDEVRSAVFSKDESFVLTASRDNYLRVWHWADNKVVDSILLTEHPHRIALTDDGQNVLVNLEEHPPFLYSFSNQKLQRDLKNEKACEQYKWLPYMKDEAPIPHSNKIGKYIVFSHDKNLWATISDDKLMIQVLNLKGEVIAEYKNEKGIADVSFSPDDQYFIVAFGNESAFLPLPRTIHNWLKTNSFPKIEFVK